MPEDNKATAPQFQVVAERRPAAAAARFFRVRDFERLQHYKDRALVWVKLYVEQLDDYEFLQLPDAAKYHFHALLLLAARSGNKIPNDPVWVGARIGASDPVDLDLLFRAGLLEAWRPRPQESYGAGEQLELPEAAGDGGGGAGVEGAGGGVLASCYQDASKSASNLLAQNRTEQSRQDTDTDTAPASAGRLCPCCGARVCSEFSYQDAFALVGRWRAEGRKVGGRPIENVGGLARTLHQEGTADAEIREFKRPPPRRREFTDEPCPSCFGSKLQTVAGKGARPCPGCVDERGQRTGKKPKEGNLDGRVDDG